MPRPAPERQKDMNRKVKVLGVGVFSTDVKLQFGPLDGCGCAEEVLTLIILLR